MRYFPEKLSITWLKQAYKEGMTPTELIEEIIRRAKKEKEKNIWIVEPSLEITQKYIDALPDRNDKNVEIQYPLWGIPFAIKDNIDLAGIPTTAACPDYQYIPDKNAFVVEKLIRAGAIPVGKTNLDQFATGLVGTRSPYGEVHNAYQPELISGGSSSGSAVSVALGMAAFSLGTDTAGSGRVPAMLNALVGWKPSLGLWSTAGVVPACASLDCVTVFANSLEGASLVNDVAQGYDTDCAWSRKYEKKGKSMPKKIYLPNTLPRFFGDYAKVYETKWKAACKRIEDMGVQIEYISYQMFEEAALILYEGAYVAERWEDLKEFVEGNPDKVFPVTEQILRSGAKKENTAAKLFGNMHDLQKYRHQAKELLEHSVMIMPTAGGTFTRKQVRENPIETNSLMGLYTNHCNLLDMMAIAVPENTQDRCNPFGITIFSLSENENLVATFAESFLQSELMSLAVCGLHKKGYPLESQIVELGGSFLEHTKTAREYKLYELDTTPKKPGLVKTFEQGNSIEVDLYQIPKKEFGHFMERVGYPLMIGDVKLVDGKVVKGFLCEETATRNAVDLTAKGTYSIEA